MDIDRAIESWIQATNDPTRKHAQRMAKEKTASVKAFYAWVQKPIDRVSRQDLLEWQAALGTQGTGQPTLRRKAGHISSFYRWAASLLNPGEIFITGPIHLGWRRSTGASLPDWRSDLSEREKQAVLQKLKPASDNGHPDRLRDYSMLFLHLSAGMSLAQIIKLRWGDVKLDNWLVISTPTRGSAVREIRILDGEFLRIFMDYLAASQMSFGERSPIWVRKQGRSWVVVSDRWFRKQIEQLVR